MVKDIEEQWKDIQKKIFYIERRMEVEAITLAKRIGLRPIREVYGKTPFQMYYFIIGVKKGSYNRS